MTDKIHDVNKATSKNSNKNVKLFLICCTLACITNLFSSFSHTSINTAVDMLDDYLNDSYSKRNVSMNENKISFIRGIYNSIYYVGQIVGAVAGPRFPDKYGRKAAYILTTIMMTISCGIQMAATFTIYPEILIFGRFFGALFAPMNDAVMIVYCQETSTPEIRGAISSLFTTGFAVMALIGMVIGTRNVLGQHLTIMLGIPIPLGIIACLFLLYLKETPKFLMITKQDRSAAKKSLEFYQGSKPENEEILNNYIQESKEQVENASMFDFITVPYLRKAILLGNATMLLGLPFYSILLSSTYCFEKIEISDEIAQIASSVLSVVLVVTCFMAIYLIKQFRRRTLLITFGVLSIVSLLIFAITGKFSKLKYLAMSGTFGYMICFGLAIGPIMNFIASELVPLQYRSSIICIVFSLNSIFVAGTNIAIAPLFELIGSLAFIPLFVISSMTALLFLYLYLPETKGYETHQIIQMLKNGKITTTLSTVNLNDTHHEGVVCKYRISSFGREVI